MSSDYESDDSNMMEDDDDVSITNNFNDIGNDEDLADLFTVQPGYNSMEEDMYVQMFIQRLINTGQMIDMFHLEPPWNRVKIPKIKQKPCLDKLKENSIYQTVSNASGYEMKNVTNSKWSVIKMLAKREHGTGGQHGGFTQQERCKINNKYLPNTSRNLKHFDTRIYCGKFSKCGNHFVTGGQDPILRVIDSSNNSYNIVNEIEGKSVQWGIMDIAFTPDGNHFAYSSWSSSIHVSRVDGQSENLQCLFMKPHKPRFCIFSIAFSNCGKLVIGGSSDGCLYFYDLDSNKRVSCVPVTTEGHIDVNTVGFIDETSNIIYTGWDNGVIKVYDSRCLDESRRDPVGVLVGHYDGITYIDPKNDSRYLISNSKDQSIKLWDIRKFSKSGCEKSQLELRETVYGWDYRWEDVPQQFYNHTEPMEDDTSIMTYRGHRIAKSLIRARFSPAETTGQRYIYTGCGTGRLVIYDVLTGSIVQSIDAHKDVIRDVDWHPTRPEIITSSWDKNININTFNEPINLNCGIGGNSSKRSRNNVGSISISGYISGSGNSDGNSLFYPRRSQRIAQQRANRL